MSVKLYFVALTAPFASAIARQLDKPVISPEFPNGGLGSLAADLEANLRPPLSSFEYWETGFIPQDCKTLAEGGGFSALDVSTFNIYYDDCEEPWIFCRHKDSPLSEKQMIDFFGSLPVRMRVYNRHIIALPGSRSAGSNGDNIVMNGDCGLTIFIHENAHSMDSHAYDPNQGKPFSHGQIWLDAYNADSAVPDSYAQSSQQENFAQQTVCAIYDNVVPGGLGNIQPNFKAIENQYNTIKDQAEDKIIPGGTCDVRLKNSGPVFQNASAKFRLSEVSKLDVSVRGNIKELTSTPMSSSMDLTYFDEAGRAVGRSTLRINT